MGAFSVSSPSKPAGRKRLQLWIAVCAFGWTAAPALAGSVQPFEGFGSNPGRLAASLYVPDGARNAALVVALHGCGQTGRGFAEEAGWVELADRFGWVLLLPEQTRLNNGLGCFNWFDAVRRPGEVESIRQMTVSAVAHVAGSAERTFAVGLSAGAAMTALLLASHPDLFAGGGMVAGVPAGCASTVPEAVLCMNRGRDLSPAAWASRARAGASQTAGAYPVVTIWQGGKDDRVVPENARELVEQWAALHGVDAGAGEGDVLQGFPRATYRDRGGRAVVEHVTLPDLGHAVPIAPGHPDPQQACGRPGPHATAVGLCSALAMARFWGLVR